MKSTFLNMSRQRTATQQNGFTLIEVLVVIAIIGILLKIAVPAYTTYVQQAHRTDAKNALLDLAAREEKYFSLNNTYTADPTQLYGTGATFPMPISTNGTAYYNLIAPTITAPTTATAATFSASASPIAGSSQASDSCGTFTINSYGVTSAATSNCW